MPITVMKEIVDLGKRISGAIDSIGETILDIKKEQLAPKETKDVNFYDYDGTVVESYTAEDFLKLSKMPELNVVHTRLTAQGWNWKLDEAQDYVEKYGMLEIGQTYIPSDGKSHFIIETHGNLDFNLIFGQTVSNGVIINWGDGSPTETIEGTDTVRAPHTYTEDGTYDITFEAVDDCEIRLGMTDRDGAAAPDGITCYFLGDWYSSPNAGQIQREFDHLDDLREIYIGKNVTVFSNYVFSGYPSISKITLPIGVKKLSFSSLSSICDLKAIIIPRSMETLGYQSLSNNDHLEVVSLPSYINEIAAYLFNNCYKLKRCSLCEGLSEMGSCMFNNNYSLENIVIPEGVDTIGLQAFGTAVSLKSIVIPSTVTEIKKNVFKAPNSIRCMRLYPQNPPVLNTGSTIVKSLYTDMIYVPYSSDHSILEAYKAATNWSIYADIMVESDPV